MQTTNFIIKNKRKIFSRLEKHSNFFEKKMNIFFEMNSIDAKVFRFKSLIRIVDMSQSFSEESPRDFFLSKKSNKIEKMRRFLQKKNINMPSNGLIYFSDQTSLQDINYLIKNLKLAFKYNYKI